ncbi:hypothetical protein [Nocardioides pocheonensis]|uniref:Gram-positive cocci surface proteins LPxTG domain-containing protein n=1 Tax=Nocardioides pocheonensis TaxID=661485 RepID=A0A3N0GJN8_9ACTN|nr:hypothetical protein [Nocardioides pocheonensis]RNM12659.1 hypothetical protein EFL26_18810 [Nocardioides pocheonensis]
MSRRQDQKHRQDPQHRLDRTHSRPLRARTLARAGAAAVAAASIGFAAPALAAHPETPSAHAAAGQAHRPTTTHVDHGTTGHHHAAHTSTPRAGTASSAQAGSSVSLAKPNDFQAQADPDGMTNGGVDQPGGTGGVDTSSQDGNNGSGNDADCEDDNRGVGVPGHCKDRPATGSEGDADSPLPGQVPDETTGQTSDLTPQLQLTPSLTMVSVATGTDSSLVSAPATGQVRGEVRTHTAAAHRATGVLPETGAGQALLGLALAALVALGLGTGLVRRGRRAAQVG